MIGKSYIKTVVNGIKTWATHLFARKDEVLTNIELTPEQIAELKGDKGDKGDTGAAGQSAYDAAKAGGYTDTESKFYADLAALQGLKSALVSGSVAGQIYYAGVLTLISGLAVVSADGILTIGG